MKHRALTSFEKMSDQLVNLAIELSREKEKGEGLVNGPVRKLRHELIVMLTGITKCLALIFRL